MKMNSIGEYLDYLFPEPKCELNYSKDYELLMSIVLSAQTTDKRVNTVTSVLFDKYNTLEKLKNAELEDLEAILRPIGSFRKKAQYVKEIAKVLDEQYDGVVPTDRDLLGQFPGVGRKTTNVFLSEFYNEPAFGVDTHVERVSKRLKIANSDDDVLKVEESLMKYFPKDEWTRRHFQLVLFGRYHCKAVKPNCSECLIKDMCCEEKKNIRS